MTTKSAAASAKSGEGAPLDDALASRLGGATRVLLLLAALPPLGLFLLSLSRVSGLESVDQFVFFYLVPLASAALFAWASRSSEAARLTFCLLIVFLAGSLLVAEVVLQVTASIRSADQSPIPGPTIGEAVDSIRASGLAAFPTIPGNVLVDRDISLAVDGVERHPVVPSPGDEMTVLCNETGTLVTYRSDRHGFNNPDPVWDQERIEVALIGDSYTHGLCVLADEQPASLLSRRFSTVNLGARGFGPLLQLAVLREYGAVLRPEVVVWVYYEGNDRYDLEREVNRPWLTAYLDDPRHAEGIADVATQAAYAEWIDRVFVEEFGQREPARNGLVDVVDVATLAAWRRVLGFGVPFPSRDSRIGRLPEVMSAAKVATDSWGGEIVFVYMPAYARFRTLVGEGVPGRREVLAAGHEAGLRVVDLTTHFEATGAPRDLWASPRGHLAPDGYRLVVDIIAAEIDAPSR